MFAACLEGGCYGYAVAAIQSVIVLFVFGLESTGVWTSVLVWAVLLCNSFVVFCSCFWCSSSLALLFLLLHLIHFVSAFVWVRWCALLCGVRRFVVGYFEAVVELERLQYCAVW